ncbi:hypothetical protein PVAND_011965 [Polypedilum vanderplanki]|uniref:Nbr1 FW domain-containing protein n=1 Tax=Polypedilum vanderplanki TaxID=319348 RepID=A0A9J6CL92_POLVA|nr:hypothetical protein PVAND_011965 [Polypedilum vanderplanki]
MDCDEERETSNVKSDSGDINSLLNSLASLNTNEKDDLVVAFQNIANELSYTTARFFLEMNNWNLQAAVGCYFDFLASSNQHTNVPMPSMRIVRELTCGLGESVTPSTQFQQSWLLENNGEVAWPQGCYLKQVSEVNNDSKMFVPPIGPHESYVITITLMSPAEVGQFKSQFCLCLPHGATFGPIIWSVVDVSISGTLSLTQQLQQLHTSQQPPKLQSTTGWEEDNSMDTGGASHNSIIQINSTSTALVPHCSNNGISDPFPIVNQSQLPAPQNSPNNDDDMMFEKINSHNL